ncbi:MAG: ABC transporter permease [Candidatus Ancillula sp.]|jgi:oligopeptide transport system permease protein|nr:ABC transporter permease [Candidatus Ancillula sp.]
MKLKHYLRHRRATVFWIVGFLLLVLTAFIGPFFVHGDSVTIVVDDRNSGPSWQHPFGTDNLGRDLLMRVLLGTQNSLIIAVIATIIQLVIGISYGSIMVFFGRRVDSFMMRLIEIITSLPDLLITMLLLIWLGNSFGAMLFALTVTAWCPTARQVRGLFLKFLNYDFVIAAQMLGSRLPKIIIKHLLPNIMSIIILDIAIAIPGYIFSEAGLSFLGVGLKSPDTSLGVLIQIGQSNIQIAPHELLIPGAILVFIVLAMNFIADAIRDVYDSRYQFLSKEDYAN